MVLCDLSAQASPTERLLPAVRSVGLLRDAVRARSQQQPLVDDSRPEALPRSLLSSKTPEQELLVVSQFWFASLG